MRAAVVTSFKEPLAIEDRPIPEPGLGQIRVRIETAGVCHTDIHAARGDWPVKPVMPLVPGHEGVGIVDALGEGVTRVSIGQRVAIPWLGGADGTCEFCVKGLETYCVNPTFTGYTVDGGYREYSVANADFVGIVPDTIDPLDAAPLTCAGVTTYKAVKAARVGPSDIVGVVGIGGLGHLAIQFANKFGYKVAAIARGSANATLAKKLGATHYIDSTSSNVAAALQQLGGAQAILATAPSSKSMSEAIDGLAPNGRLMVVGADSAAIEVTPIQLITGVRTIQGWASETPADSEDTLRFAELSGVRPMIETYPLERAAEAYARMISGKAQFRVVLTM